MKLGTASLNDQQHEWMKMYKEALERDSGHRIRVDIYPSAQLGSIPREIEDTQFGAIQGWVGPPEFLTGIDQRFEVLGIPSVFANDEQVNKTLVDPQFATPFMALASDKGLVGISLFVTAGPVLEGVTRMLGATPVPMSLDQVLPALQQGAIDGIISSVAVTTPLKYYTVAPYVKPMPGYTVDITVISKSWLASLPPDLQKIVLDDGLKIGRAIVPFTTSYLARQAGVWTSGGGHIDRFPPAEEKAFTASVASIGHDVTSTNPDLAAMYATLLTTAAKYK
jgi:TRAP-type C4-dicarboxylate transport system substrate-binding protein